MPLESRSRMISFRLTDEEYDRFRRLCVSRGLRNVSELVRAAVNQLVGDGVIDQPMAGIETQARINDLELRLTDLASAVARMENRLTSSHATSASPNHFAQSAVGQ